MDLYSIGRNIRKYRLKRSMSQEKLAEETDLSKNFISQVELGNKKLSLESLIKISNALNISSDLILSDVINVSYIAKTSELNDKIKDLSIEEQKFVYATVDNIVDELKARKIKF